MARTTTRPTSPLDVYDIAFLAGGLPRLVDTVVVALVRLGRVRVHGPGELAVVDTTRRHPVEAAVLDAIGPRGHRSVDTVRYRLATDPRIADVERRLRGDGLLARSPLTALRRRRPAIRPSASGRRALAERRTAAPSDDALRVALDGRGALLDGTLRAVFDRPAPRFEIDRRAIRDARLRARMMSPELRAHQAYGAGFGGGMAFGGGFSDGGGGGGDGGS